LLPPFLFAIVTGVVAEFQGRQIHIAVELFIFSNLGDFKDMTSRQRQIKKMYDYIWGLKGKCDGIQEINKALIMQFCRFSVLADETSASIEEGFNDVGADMFEDLIKKYEKLNKSMLILYKVLKFEQIKDEIANYGNPFIELSQEAETDGDL
jgi:hypothetical protein